MENELSQYVAASLVEYAQRMGNDTFSQDLDEVLRLHPSFYDWVLPEDVILDAVDILCDLGIASTSADKYAGTFFSIEKGAFQDFWAAFKIEKERADELDGDDVVFDYEDRIAKFRAYSAMQKYPIIQRYGRFGAPWIEKAISNLRTEIIDGKASPVAELPIASASWTGRSSTLLLAGEKRQELITLLEVAERNLEELDVSNEEKAFARAIIIASRALSEAPEPQDDLVWEIISRANQMAGIASLFVSILALFTAAAS